MYFRSDASLDNKHPVLGVSIGVWCFGRLVICRTEGINLVMGPAAVE